MGLDAFVPPQMGFVGAGGSGDSSNLLSGLVAGATLGSNRQVPYNGDGLLGGSGLGLIALLALLGGNRGGLFGNNGIGGGLAAAEVDAGNIASKVVELQNTSDLKGEVKSVEAGLRESLLNQTIGLGGEFRGLEGKIDRAALDAVKAQFEAKIASLEATNVITNKVGNVETEIQAVKCALDNKINASTQAILERFTQDELLRLRTENERLSQTVNFGTQFAAIASQLNNLAQEQRLTNQVVQFGAGNVATPVATNNQVR